MAKTRRKLVDRAASLPGDQSVVLFTFADGWTVREISLYGDLVREGALMSNCLTNTSDCRHEIWDYYNQDDDGGPLQPDDERYRTADSMLDEMIPEHQRFASLRDPDNIPHLTFELVDDDLCHVLGRHNSEPKWEHLERLQEWASLDPDIQLKRYYDFSEASSSPWPPTPINEWFQHHYEFAHHLGRFSYMNGQAPALATEAAHVEHARAAVAWWAEQLGDDPRIDEDQLAWFEQALEERLLCELDENPNAELWLTPGRPPGDYLRSAILAAGAGFILSDLNGKQMLLDRSFCAVRDGDTRYQPVSGILPEHLAALGGLQETGALGLDVEQVQTQAPSLSASEL